VFTELTKLDLVLTRCVIMIYDTKTNDARWWMANSEVPEQPMNFLVKYHEYAPNTAYIKAWKEKTLKWVYTLEGQIKKDWDDFLFTETELSQLPDFVIAGMKAPEKVYLNASFNNFGSLTLPSLESLSEEHFDIMLRFAKVFDLTYTRFNDLKQAETQAREAQVEAALERVRSRTMGMQHSEELSKTASEMFKQIQDLGMHPWACGFNIFDKDEKTVTQWMSLADGGISPPFRTPLTEDPFFINIYEARQQKEELLVMESSGKELEETYRYMFSLPGSREIFGDLENSGFEMPKFQITHCAYFSQGYLVFITYEPVPESWDIFKRFAKVFEQTYTRFLDLQKAEAQAREAQIEAALERVRSKAMAMHKSEDLKLTVATVFEELDKLNLGLIRCGIAILDKEKPRGDIWITIKSDQDSTIEVSGDEPLDIHPLLERAYDAWLKQEDFSYVLQGDDLVSYYQALGKTNFQQPVSASVDTEKKDQQQFYFNAVFRDGSLFAFLDTAFTEEAKKVMNRFANVFDLTYKRFLDLQKAEAQTLEAIKRASVDRVRAEIASMRTTNDLERIQPLIWNELKILGIPFIRCGVFIMDEEQKLIHTFLSTPDGKAIAAFHLPYNTPGNIEQVLNHWHDKKTYVDHWDESAFTEFAGTLVKQGALTSPELYLKTIPRGGFYLHFLPF
ncbi:MAG TPA: hypothetical protein VI461_06415, partial [Chitinophagaceae bacterium]|nr:hypothetical protein [Chitinophagaceae bacterium]